MNPRILVALITASALAIAGAVSAVALPVSAGALFADAPSSQANSGVVTGLCPLAASDVYLPARAGCVEVRQANLDGSGKDDLVILYSVLTRERPVSIGLPPSLKGLFVAKQAYLEVVLPSGARSVIGLGVPAAAILSVAHVSAGAADRVLLEIDRASSGANAAFYGLSGGKLVAAGPMLGWGGDSADRAGFSCSGRSVVQRNYALIGPTIYATWRETEITYDWHGARLAETRAHSFNRRGLPSGSAIAIGRSCLDGVR